MTDNEAIIMKGFHQYSNYEGYGSTFKHKEYIAKDFYNNKILIAIDALDYSTPAMASVQFSVRSI